jgi:hypothetical protein
MNIQQHTSPNSLERYSFLWSEARLLIAALALFIGGIPPLVVFGPFPSGLTSSILTLSWIVSGLASGYLLFRWLQGGKILFGGKVGLDRVAFFISVISGLNLGLTGVLGRNVGMSISSNRGIFVIAGLIYLVAAGYLYKRWKSSTQRIF